MALYTAAQAWELADEPARAADAYHRSLSTPKLNERQAKRARERLDALEKQLGVVVVLGAETTRVQLDDHTEVNAPARLHGKAGSHVLLIIKQDGTVGRRNLQLKTGETVEVDSDAAPPPEPETEPEEPKEAKTPPKPLAEPKKKPVRVEKEQSDSDPLLLAGWISTGAGVAALGGAALLGMSANSAADAYEAGPTRESFDHASSLETRTNIMLIAGSLLTLGGVGLVVWRTMGSESEGPSDGKGKVELGASGSGVWARGSF